MKAFFKLFCTLILVIIFSQATYAQDLILKTNGDTIRAKITEIGTNAISFKKTNFIDGPLFVEQKSDIILIKYGNGQIEHFSKPIPKIPSADSLKLSSASTYTNSNTPKNSITNSTTQQSSDGKVKIEMISTKKFTINGQKASRKEVNAQLGKSKNPAILLALKGTKLTGGAQKIVKITSIPTTIGGGATSVFTLIEGYQLLQRGRATSKSLLNIGMSLVGTLAFPITSKILNKKSGKMYTKIIDMYNLTN